MHKVVCLSMAWPTGCKYRLSTELNRAPVSRHRVAQELHIIVQCVF